MPVTAPCASQDHQDVVPPWYLPAFVFAAAILILVQGIAAASAGGSLLRGTPSGSDFLLIVGVPHLASLVAMLSVIIYLVPAETRVAESGLDRFNWEVPLHAWLWVLPTLPAVSSVSLWSRAFFQQFQNVTHDPVVHWAQTGSAGLYVAIFICAVLIAPLNEELLFRQVMHRTVHHYARYRFAADVTASFCFALLHGIPEHIAPLFVLGMILQLSRNRSGTLWLPVCIHAAFNATVLLLARIAA